MDNLIEKSLKSLFPTGEIAWDGMNNGTMREISDGLAIQGDRDYKDGKSIVTDFYPNTTTLQTEWEETYKLPAGEILTPEQRTARLNAVWSREEVASFDGMNHMYELSGIPVIARPLLPSEDPRVIAEAKPVFDVFTTVFDDVVFGVDSVFGGFSEIEAEFLPTIFADGRPGDPAINYLTVFDDIVFGVDSVFGDFEGSRVDPPQLTIPDETWTWPMIYIIEGLDGEFAEIPIELKDAYEFLTYKNKPNFMWAISRVVFFEEPIPVFNENIVTDDGFTFVTDDGFNIVTQTTEEI
jgi:hypothetical protein